MAELHPLLEGALTLDGRQRYYPPGMHPATYRWRKQREALVKLPESKERDELIAYIDEHLAMFEAGESEAKARDLYRMQERMRRALEDDSGAAS